MVKRSLGLVKLHPEIFLDGTYRRLHQPRTRECYSKNKKAAKDFGFETKWFLLGCAIKHDDFHHTPHHQLALGCHAKNESESSREKKDSTEAQKKDAQKKVI